MPTPPQVLDALKKVRFPGLSRDIVSFGFVQDVRVEGGRVSFALRFQTENPGVAQQISREAEAAVRQIPDVTDVHIDLDVSTRGGAQSAGAAEQRLATPRSRKDKTRRPQAP